MLKPSGRARRDQEPAGREWTRTVVVRSRTFEPAAKLREVVRVLRFLKTSATVQAATRPVIARTGIVLTFNLHTPKPQILDYGTSRRRVLPDVLIVGPQSIRRTDIDMTTGWTSFAVHFQPAGFYRLFRVPVPPFTNTIVDAVEVLGPDIKRLHASLRTATRVASMQRLVELFLLKQLAEARPPHPVERAASSILERHGDVAIADISRDSGIGQRQFERCFVEQVGLAPKVFARVARLSFVLQHKTLNPRLSWNAIAAQAGYYDYKHLANDFKAIVGATPTVYMNSPRRLDDGFLLLRERGLHRNG